MVVGVVIHGLVISVATGNEVVASAMRPVRDLVFFAINVWVCSGGQKVYPSGDFSPQVAHDC